MKFSIASGECLHNCFLGGSFFSSPLDLNRCCDHSKKDENCEYYTPMLNSMVCFRCKLGYQWNNNQCVEFGQLEPKSDGKKLKQPINIRKCK
jgi:hypothetical protein